ncbi:hypothetical protein [Variovorax sp. YR216]|uniref:hypothetical protein n=1 Tax=Variovorax sp. YR216 TaxID=1882828 RepID=UPI000897248A|nr:hypothetical protein [Variovorax sp. YR216]SEB26311.1 hypothetical protein SAMN05444680_13113 [Variovorax sp. YR216]
MDASKNNRNARSAGKSQKPAAPTSAFFWRGQPSILAESFRRSRQGRGEATGKHRAHFSPPIEGSAAGQQATDKRAALVRRRI